MAVFSTVKEFNKNYEAVRKDILVRHGIEDGKKARLKNAVRLYMSVNGSEFVPVSTVKRTMVDFIRMREETGNYVYKLEAMV